jgi:hypothetical protein
MDSLEESMQDLINSFVRLSAAMTVYSMQQMQSAVDTIDPIESVTKLRNMIDSMADALTAQVDESKKQTVESISNLGADVVERVSSLDPRDLVQTTSDMVRKTTDSLASMVKSDKKASAGTPQAVGQVLA